MRSPEPRTLPLKPGRQRTREVVASSMEEAYGIKTGGPSQVRCCITHKIIDSKFLQRVAFEAYSAPGKLQLPAWK